MPIDKQKQSAIRKSLKTGASAKAVAHIHGVTVEQVMALQSVKSGTRIQELYDERRRKVAMIDKEIADAKKAEGIQPIEFTQNQLNLTLTKVYDEAATGSYPTVNLCLGKAGVAEKDQEAVSRRSISKMNNAAWIATANHEEAKAMQQAGYRTRNDKADACNSSVSHLIKSVQSKHRQAVRQLNLIKEIEELKARLAIVEDHTTINPTSKAEAMRVASNMKAQGSTQLEIANAVGKTERTIRRWWSEL